METQTPLDRIAFIAEAIRKGDDERPVRLASLRGAKDNDSLYYRLLYHASLYFRPAHILEIGTYVGTSAAHLAAFSGAKVVTVDINPDAKAMADRLGIPNVESVVCDSSIYAKRLANVGAAAPILDILFIDGNHTFNQMYGEYFMFRPFMRLGGLVFVDDIHLPMDGSEMDVAWDLIPDRKMDLPGMHHTGFGVAQVDHSIPMLPWEMVIAEASKRILDGKHWGK